MLYHHKPLPERRGVTPIDYIRAGNRALSYREACERRAAQRLASLRKMMALLC